MKAAVVGSGAWGTALAVRLCKNGHDVTMWTYEKDKIPEMLETHHNPRLPAAVLPEALKISGDYDCVRGCKLVVMASPSFPLRAVSRGVAPYIDGDAVVVSVTKGLEQNTHMRMSQVVAQETGKNVVALTGPSHAEEVAFDMPTAVVAASEDEAAALLVQRLFSNDALRIYTSSDVHGVELCGAIKNVIAFACGIARGLGYGDNSSAALVTRGIAEMRRLGTALGFDPETFFGLACTGDLVVTAGSLHSRNLRCGKLVGSGVPVDEARRQIGAVVEGLNALPAVIELSEKLGVEMPICDMVNKVVSGQIEPGDATALLMGRELKQEGPQAYEA